MAFPRREDSTICTGKVLATPQKDVGSFDYWLGGRAFNAGASFSVTGATIAAVEGADTAAATAISTAARIAGTDDTDVAAITAASAVARRVYVSWAELYVQEGTSAQVAAVDSQDVVVMETTLIGLPPHYYPRSYGARYEGQQWCPDWLTYGPVHFSYFAVALQPAIVSPPLHADPPVYGAKYATRQWCPRRMSA